MRYVGGYESYLALTERERDFDDVLLVLMAEGEAEKLGPHK